MKLNMNNNLWLCTEGGY